MTLNGVTAVTLRYFNELGKPAFQLRITYSSIVGFYNTQNGEVSVRN